jgi:hypothetical protein
LTKGAVENFGWQISVAGGNDPDIDPNRFCAAHRKNFPVFDHPEQLALKQDRHIPYFIQKQCPVIRQFEPPSGPNDIERLLAIFGNRHVAPDETEHQGQNFSIFYDVIDDQRVNFARERQNSAEGLISRTQLRSATFSRLDHRGASAGRSPGH